MSDPVQPGGRRLPDPIERSLNAALRRMHRMLILRGCLATGAGFLCALLAAVAIDASVTLFSSSARWALSLAAYGVAAWLGYRYLYLPLRRYATLRDVACRLETRHPELEERLSSTIELLDEPAVRGGLRSEAMVEELVRETIRDVGDIRPEQEFNVRAFRGILVTAASAGAVLLLIVLFWPRQAVRLVARAAAPYADIGDAGAVDLTVTPGDALRARGTALEIRVRTARPGLRRAAYRQRIAGGSETVEEMTREDAPAGGPSVFVYRIPAVETNFRYRVHAARGLTRYYDVTVADPPRPRSARVKYEYPPYTGRPAAWFDLNPDGFGRITGVAGTRVTLEIGAGSTVRSAALTRAAGALPAERSRGTNGAPVWVWALALGVTNNATYALNLVDGHGLTNLPFSVTFEAVADEIPTAERASPAQDRLRMKPQDRMPFAYKAWDDYGIASCEMEVKPDGGPPLRIPLPRPTHNEAAGSWNGMGALDLALLDLSRSRTVTMVIRVADGLPEALKGPQQATTKPLVIDLDAGAADYLDSVIAAMEGGFVSQINGIVTSLTQAGAQVTALSPALQAEGALPPAAAAQANAARTAAAKAEAGLQDLADKLAATPYAPLAEEARALAEEQVAPVRGELEEISLTDAPKERAEKGKSAAAGIEKSLKAAQELTDRVKQHSMELAEMKRIENMAGRERDLADQAEKMAADAEPDKAWKEQQKKLREEMEKTLAKDVENKVQPADKKEEGPKEKKPPLKIPFSGGGGGSGKGSGSEGTGFAIAGSAAGAPMSKKEMEQMLGDLKKRTMDRAVSAESAPNAKKAAQLSEEAAEFLASIAGIMETQAGVPEGPVMAGGPSEGGEGGEGEGSESQSSEGGGDSPPGQSAAAGGSGKWKPGSSGQYRLAKQRMQELGLASEDWLRLPSELREDILQAGEGRAPEEYRELIRSYFRDIATKGSR